MDTNGALVTIICKETNSEHPLPEPTSYSGSTSTLVDAGTSVSGHLLGSVVRGDVAQIALSWNYLAAEDWAKANELFKRSYINEVRFFDQALGDWNSREMYVSDRNAGMWRRDSNGKVLGWTGCGLQLMEV